MSSKARALLQDILAQAVRYLKDAGIASASLDASLLLAHTLGLTREQLLSSSDKVLNNGEITSFHVLVARRAQHEPIAYITGKKEFWSLDFYVTSDTLIPRPDSETLVEAALKWARNHKVWERAKPIRILDIGTGTGCLLIALLKELPKARGVGVDNNNRALRVAEENAKRHGVETRAQFIQSNWCDAIDGTFDLILSNPPYIAAGDMPTLMPDVVFFEPHAALVAGEDGFEAYRALSPQVAARLTPGGYVFFEAGQGQAQGIEELLRKAGLKTEKAEKDLTGIARCVVARKK